MKSSRITNEFGLQDVENLADKIRVEFAIKTETADDMSKIESLLSDKLDVKIVSKDFNAKTIQLELNDGEISSIHGNRTNSAGTIQAIQRLIEKDTGIVTAVKGLGSHSSAVAELRPVENSSDGLVEGFDDETFHRKRKYSLAIHQYGDMNGIEYGSLGESEIPINESTNYSDKKVDYSMSVRKIIPECNVMSMIGKSVALTEYCYDSNYETEISKRVLSAGVIARAATIETNTKQICSCSGKTIWEERIERQKQ